MKINLENVILIMILTSPCIHASMSVFWDYFVDPMIDTTDKIASFASGKWNGLKSRFYETCRQPWVTLDTSELHNLLDNKLHGQHLAKEISWKHLKSHWENKRPSKALVLSFHGWTGTGKNFVSKLIAKSMFKKGMSSVFVKLFICTYEFPMNDDYHVQRYKVASILSTVKRIVSQCAYALIIFDEIDKAPFGIVDIIKPFLDYHDSIDGVDYRKSTFIFLSPKVISLYLSNTGGSAISKNVYEFWKVGQREEITLKDLENQVMIEAYNEKGGMKGMDIIDKNLVSAYVPFLPLERKQVKLCIKDEVATRRVYVSDELINKIADQLDYFPEDTMVFSKTGCKRVSEKVDFLTADEF
ncbi:Torsin-1B [Nymphon striatum]|nr:Torsin-1B [Nymphon striatum]